MLITWREEKEKSTRSLGIKFLLNFNPVPKDTEQGLFTVVDLT